MSPLAPATAYICDTCKSEAERLITLGTGDRRVRICKSCARKVWVDAHRPVKQRRAPREVRD